MSYFEDCFGTVKKSEPNINYIFLRLTLKIFKVLLEVCKIVMNGKSIFSGKIKCLFI